ncbi:MAG: hypothetical protein ABJA20_14435 [Novosphingobium sp.]
MIAIFSSIILASSAVPDVKATTSLNAVTSICTADSFGDSGDHFILDVSKGSGGWHLKISTNDESSWILGSITPDKVTIKLLRGENGQQVLFGQARGPAGGRFYSILLGGDVVDGNAVNFAVDVFSYGDAEYSKSFRRIISEKCRETSGKLSVEGLS